MMKFRLVRYIDGQFVDEEFASEALAKRGFDIRGFKAVGFNVNPRQRTELQGRPKFEGLIGPMWNRDAIRYEDPEANQILSV